MEKSKQTKKGKLINFITMSCIIIFLAVAALNIWRVKNRKPIETIKQRKIPVQIYIVKNKNLNNFIESTGNILPLRRVKIYPRIPGKIIETIMVQRGDKVEKGQIIATLENSQIKAQLDRARAQIELATANRDVLKKDYSRIKDLFKHKAASHQKLDHIKAELKAAKARVKEAEAALKVLKVIYEEHNIHATISGIVSNRYLDPGSFSNPGVPILEIDDENIIKLITSVPESIFPHIKKGMQIEFTTDAYPKTIFSGKIFRIYPVLNPQTRSANIEIRIPNKKLMLRSGMFAHVRIDLGVKRALAVPLDGLIKMSGTGNYYAFTISNGKAHIRNIKTGIIQNNLVEIISGLKLGDKMVIKGQRQLKDGIDVKIINQDKIANNKNFDKKTHTYVKDGE